MWLLYLVAFIPIIIGGILWIARKEIVILEWVIGSVIALITAAIFHVCIIQGMTGDDETWSGYTYKTIYYPKWVEKYHETHRVTDSKGKVIRTYTDTHYRTHGPEWEAYHNFGTNERTIDISQQRYEEIKKDFGNKVEIDKPGKSGFYSGDPNVYTVNNKTNKMLPVTRWMSFENRVKAAPSVFSYQKVTDKTPVFDYPKNTDYDHSDRLLGDAKRIVNLYQWDCMNTRLGPTKKVNVILVGFKPNSDSFLANLQEAKWVGGKKNDLVICYSPDNSGKPLWTRVFGWTEEELVKRNLETLLLKNINAIDLIPQIEQEIIKNYKIKDWKKFDYITLEPPIWAYIVLLVVIMVTQGGYYVFVSINDFNKEGRKSRWRC